MNFKKETKLLQVLNVIECILSLSAIIIFTLIFRLDNSNIRYLFLVGDLVVIYSFSKTLQNLEIKSQENKRIIKNANHKIEAKYFKKISV